MANFSLRLSDCWAKTDPASGLPALTVRDHCLIVGAVAEALGATPVFTWLSGCHDVGKISPGFLAKSFIWLQDHHLTEVANSRLWKSAETDHSKVSQFSLQHHLRNHQAMSKDDAALWAALSSMHHGSPHWRGKWNEYPPGIVPDDHWEILRQELIHELAACFNVCGRQQWPQIELSSQAHLFRLAGLTSVADWIGSDERFFPPAGMEHKFDLDDLRVTARDAISQIGFAQPNFTLGLEFDELFGFHPNKLQVETLATITEPGVLRCN